LKFESERAVDEFLINPANRSKPRSVYGVPAGRGDALTGRDWRSRWGGHDLAARRAILLVLTILSKSSANFGQYVESDQFPVAAWRRLRHSEYNLRAWLKQPSSLG